MKKLVSFAVAGMFALSLAACGSSSSAAASITESSAESTAASTADSAAADSDLAYLQNKGKMTIGYTVYEPMNYTDESGTFTGFDTELATAVCEKLGVEPDFVEINWDTKETELAAKSIDCIWNGLTLTDDREANMACTKPYVKNAQVVVMKADADYTSTADLAGKTVVAESGSAGETTIEEDEGLQQADFVAKSVQTDCLMEVAAGTADAAVLDLTLASAMIGEGTDYANLVIKDELNVEEYGAAFRKGSDVAAAVDNPLARLEQRGARGHRGQRVEEKKRGRYHADPGRQIRPDPGRLIMGEAGVIWSRLTSAFLMNCQLFGLTLLFALPLGLLVSLGSMSRFTPLRGVVKTFVWIIRGTPLMLQIIVIYLGPGLMGFASPWGSSTNGRLLAAVVAFVINYACYFSEIYRGGIESVPVGQTEAGQVLGMTKSQIFFRVTLLQVIKRILAPMGNEVMTLIKDTSLANVIANKEIIMMAKEYSAKGLIWPLFSTALFFLVFVGAMTLLFNWLEKKLSYFR